LKKTFDVKKFAEQFWLQAQNANGVSLAQLKAPEAKIDETSLTGAQKLSELTARTEKIGGGSSWIAEASAQKAPESVPIHSALTQSMGTENGVQFNAMDIRTFMIDYSVKA